MIIERYENNPVLGPRPDEFWEAEAVFNGCPAKKGNLTYLLYRALSLPHYHTIAQRTLMISDIGIASSSDGLHFENRTRFVVPEEEWERFGCEDPRVTELDGKYYTFYTALSSYPFSADGIKVGVAVSKDLETIQEKHLVTPFNAKGMALFPGKINGKLWAMLTVHTDRPPAKICLAAFNKEKDIWSNKYWEEWYKDFEEHSLPLQRKPEDHIEVGAPPVKTKEGWLCFYSYIRDYSSSKPLFTIEAVLLDLEDPTKIITRTEVPILTPEKYYEKAGIVPNIVFPSGALQSGNWINLYYGAADTTCCLVRIELSSLLDLMFEKNKMKAKLKRAKENPIIVPDERHSWESKATFNPAALYLGGKTHLLYRAMSADNTSVLGYATSSDGIHIDYRSPNPVYTPRESFEQKLVAQSNSGCEDPRLTEIEDKIVMLYTAFDSANPPRVALSWIRTEDFLKKNWSWSKPVAISAPGIDDKDAFVFPEKVQGKYMVVHRSGEDIDYALVSSLDFKEDEWLEEHRWIGPRKGWWDSRKIGAAAAPIKTKKGWVLLYHGVSRDGVYRVGAVLLDLHDPLKVICRTDHPIFEPETSYEKGGQVANVVFPCGMVLREETLFVYYGGGDKVVGVATIPISKLLEVLQLCRCATQ